MTRRAESLVEAVEAGMPRRSRKDGGAIVIVRYGGYACVKCKWAVAVMLWYSI